MGLFVRKKKQELIPETPEAVSADGQENIEADVDAIMRKYDRESNTRVWTGIPKKVVGTILALFSLYCMWSTLFSTDALEKRLTMFLGLIIVMGFLT